MFYTIQPNCSPRIYQVLGKDIIEMEILCYIPLNKRDFRPKIPHK